MVGMSEIDAFKQPQGSVKHCLGRDIESPGSVKEVEVLH